MQENYINELRFSLDSFVKEGHDGLYKRKAKRRESRSSLLVLGLKDGKF